MKWRSQSLQHFVQLALYKFSRLEIKIHQIQAGSRSQLGNLSFSIFPILCESLTNRSHIPGAGASVDVARTVRLPHAAPSGTAGRAPAVVSGHARPPRARRRRADKISAAPPNFPPSHTLSRLPRMPLPKRVPTPPLELSSELELAPARPPPPQHQEPRRPFHLNPAHPSRPSSSPSCPRSDNPATLCPPPSRAGTFGSRPRVLSPHLHPRPRPPR